MNNLHFIIIIIILCSCTTKKSKCFTKETLEVNFNDLITHPKNYEDKHIIVEGYYSAGFEVSVLYKTVYDKNYLIDKRGIWISDSANKKIRENFKNKYVIVSGIFNTKNEDNIEKYIGTIDIDCME
jgi:hypothetical protein